MSEITTAPEMPRLELEGLSETEVVDAVTEVLMVSEDAVEPTPEAVSGAHSGYIRGIAKLAGQLVILLDLSALFAAGELAAPARAA